MERIKTRKNCHREIYRDASTRGKYNGRLKKRHDCWRADVTINDASGLRRIRKRFASYEEAKRWLMGY